MRHLNLNMLTPAEDFIDSDGACKNEYVDSAQLLVTLPQQHWVPRPYKEGMVYGACWWADG